MSDYLIVSDPLGRFLTVLLGATIREWGQPFEYVYFAAGGLYLSERCAEFRAPRGSRCSVVALVRR